MLQHREGDRTEIIALSLWDSVEAIRAFAGDDIDAAVLYPEDERYLINGLSSVAHYDVIDWADPSPARPSPGLAPIPFTLSLRVKSLAAGSG